MSALRARGLGWTWTAGAVALDGLDLDVARGERVLITGPSGCGKSTLLRLVGGLLPGHGAGRRRGELTVGGADPASWDGPARAAAVGLVFQEPADQLVTGRLADELAFGAVSAGRRPRPGWLRRLGLPREPDRDPRRLSGGQQQRLAVGAALAAGAPLLALDEPLAHLDGAGAAALLGLLDRLARSGRGILLVEHRLEAALGWADRVVVLREGRAVWDGGRPPDALLRGDGLLVPPMARIDAAGGLDRLGPVRLPARAVGAPIARLQVPELRRGVRPVLGPVDLALRAGERVAVVGPNGAGKSTLLAALGRAVGADGVAVPQDPDLALFCPTVADELAWGPRERGRAPSIQVASLGLGGLEDRSPLALSRGQRQRVAVGAAAAVGAPVLLLDEPTAGQHADAVRATLAAVGAASPGGLVFATHDVELALACADRAIVLGGGRILADGPPEQALSALGTLPPLQAAQRARGWPLADVERQLTAGEGPTGEPTPADRGRAWPTRHPWRGRPHRFRAPQGAVRSRRTGPPPPTPTSYGALLAVAGVGALAVLLDRPLSLALLAGASLFALLTRPIGARNRRRVLLGALAVVWSTALSQGLFYGDLPRTALLRLGPLTIWQEGLGWGIVQSLRLIAVSSAGLAVALTASPDRLFAVLRGLRIPGGLAFLALMALRFVPTVAGEWGTVRAARDARGRARRGPWGWLRAELLALRPLVARALRRAGRLAEALESRGFEPTRERGPVPAWTLADRAVAGLGGLLVGAVAGLQGLTALYLAEIWRHPALNPVYAWVRAWL